MRNIFLVRGSEKTMKTFTSFKIKQSVSQELQFVVGVVLYCNGYFTDLRNNSQEKTQLFIIQKQKAFNLELIRNNSKIFSIKFRRLVKHFL